MPVFRRAVLLRLACVQVFGIDPHTPQRPDQVAGLSVEPARGNEVSQRINNVVAQLRRDRPTRPALYVIRQGRHPLAVPQGCCGC